MDTVEGNDVQLSERKPIYVVGYPKSGNTWLSRLLGDALDSPIISGEDNPALADEGFSRDGKYVIRQRHIRHKNKPDDGRIVFIVRDPRDIAVSVMYYWQRKSLMDVICGMAGKRNCGKRAPLSTSGGWIRFVSEWLCDCDFHAFCKYENLYHRPVQSIRGILWLLGTSPVKPLKEVVERQAFDKRKAGIHNMMPYGEEIQNRLMRKGTVGDWKNHFKCNHAEFMHKNFYELMEHFNYETNEDWWRDVCNN